MTESVLIIDPGANTVDVTSITRLGGLGGADASKWSGGVLAENGKIYGIPYTTHMARLIIDPSLTPRTSPPSPGSAGATSGMVGC
jgi:hypothetical protein